MPSHDPAKQLEEKVDDVEERLHKEIADRFHDVHILLKKLQHQLVTRWVVGMIGILIIAGGLTYVAIQASHTAHSAQTAITQVKQDRADAILTQCELQNDRHTKTVAFFNNFVKTYESSRHLTAVQKAQLQSQVQTNLTLISDLAPRQNCKALVKQETTGR